MAQKLGHFRVVHRQASLLRLERRSESAVLVGVVSGILLIIIWFLKPWQSFSGLVVSLAILALSLSGIIAVLYLRPLKEVLVFDRLAGHFLKKEQYLLRRSKVLRLPLDSIEGLRSAQRTLRIVDKKGQMVEHVYWAALVRSTSGAEIELDGANDPAKIRELVKTVSEFVARASPPTP